MYVIPNRKQTTRVVPLPMPFETPLRTGNLRDPDGPQVQFALESFIDELAARAKADPVEFRLRMLQAGAQDDSGFKRARSIACIKAAAAKFGWDPRPSPKQPNPPDQPLVGPGNAHPHRHLCVYQGHHPLSPALVAALFPAATAGAEKLATIPTPNGAPPL